MPPDRRRGLAERRDGPVPLLPDPAFLLVDDRAEAFGHGALEPPEALPHVGRDLGRAVLGHPLERIVTQLQHLPPDLGLGLHAEVEPRGGDDDRCGEPEELGNAPAHEDGGIEGSARHGLHHRLAGPGPGDPAELTRNLVT